MKTKHKNIIDILKEAKEHDVPFGLTATAIEQLEPEGEITSPIKRIEVIDKMLHKLCAVEYGKRSDENIRIFEYTVMVIQYLEDQLLPPQQPSEGEMRDAFNKYSTPSGAEGVRFLFLAEFEAAIKELLNR